MIRPLHFSLVSGSQMLHNNSTIDGLINFIVWCLLQGKRIHNFFIRFFYSSASPYTKNRKMLKQQPCYCYLGKKFLRPTSQSSITVMEVDITEINDDEKQSSKKQKITITYQSGTHLLRSDCFLSLQAL